MTVGVTMKEIFNQSQSGIQGHGKLVKALQKLYEQTEFAAFWAEFSHYLKYAMIVFKREPAVERVIEFVGRFITSLTKPEQEAETKEGEGEEDEEDPIAENLLLQEMFDFLLKSHDARDRAVRFRTCQLINKLLSNLGEEAQIDDDLYDRLYECMLQRLRDKCPVVRYMAVLAMSRLQDPTDENCPVIKAYLFLLNCDPNADVRRAILTNIAPSTRTLSSIIGRTKDVKNSVRKVAFEVIAEKVHVKALSIASRLQILNEGLTDRDELVQQACSGKMLQAWLRTFGGNVLDLLKCLDVEDSTDICSLVLKTLFKGSAPPDLVQKFDILDDRLLIPFEQLTSESALYWQATCKYLHEMGAEGDEYLDKVLPACVDFCAYVQQYIQELKTITDPEIQLGREFIIQQLLMIAGYMDIADSASRKAVETLLHNMLLADVVSHRLVKPVVTQLCDIKVKVDTVVAYFAETVSEIREPITIIEKGMSDDEKRQTELKVASVRVKLNQMREDLDEAVRTQNFTVAADLKEQVAVLESEKTELLKAAEVETEEVRTEKNDTQTILKCQTIISEFLQCVKLASITPTLQMMIETQIVPGIQHGDEDVRYVAMKALGICTLNSKDLMATYIPLFMQASQLDVEAVRVMALQVLIDLLLIYGMEIGGTEDNNEKQETTGDRQESSSDVSMATEKMSGVNDEERALAASKLVAIICSFLDGDSSELRAYSAEGLCKLLLSGRVVSPKILSHLILLWYNPLSEDNSQLRDCLGTFFPVYALAARANQEVVEQAFLPTLKTLINAPATSPLAEVNVNNVAELLVHLTNTKLLTSNQNLPEVSQDNPGHDNLSETVCNEILSNPTSVHLRLWAKILNQMEVSPDNEVILKDLRILCHKIVQVVKEKVSLKSLQKFQARISELASKFVSGTEDLDSVDVAVVTTVEEPEDQSDTITEQVTKKKRNRGLYSHSVTLGLDSESELDVTQDNVDVDASSLMSRNPTLTDTPRRRLSKKMSTSSLVSEVTAEDDNVFLAPQVPGEKGSEQVAEVVQEVKDGGAQSPLATGKENGPADISSPARATNKKKLEIDVEEPVRKSPKKSPAVKSKETSPEKASPRRSPTKSPRLNKDKEEGEAATKKQKLNKQGDQGKRSPRRSLPEPVSRKSSSPRSRSATRKSASPRLSAHKQTSSRTTSPKGVTRKSSSPRTTSAKSSSSTTSPRSATRKASSPRTTSARSSSSRTASPSSATHKASSPRTTKAKSLTRTTSPRSATRKASSPRGTNKKTSPKSVVHKTLSPRTARSKPTSSRTTVTRETQGRSLSRTGSQNSVSSGKRSPRAATSKAASAADKPTSKERSVSRKKKSDLQLEEPHVKSPKTVAPKPVPKTQTKSENLKKTNVAGSRKIARLERQKTGADTSKSQRGRRLSDSSPVRKKSKPANDSSPKPSPGKPSRTTKVRGQLSASSQSSQESSPASSIQSRSSRASSRRAGSQTDSRSSSESPVKSAARKSSGLARAVAGSEKNIVKKTPVKPVQQTDDDESEEEDQLRRRVRSARKSKTGTPKPVSQLAARKESVGGRASPREKANVRVTGAPKPAPRPAGLKSPVHSTRSSSVESDRENRRPLSRSTRGSSSPATPRTGALKKTTSQPPSSPDSVQSRTGKATPVISVSKAAKTTPKNAASMKSSVRHADSGRAAARTGSSRQTQKVSASESDGESDLFSTPPSSAGRVTRSVLKSGASASPASPARGGQAKALAESKQNRDKKLAGSKLKPGTSRLPVLSLQKSLATKSLRTNSTKTSKGK